jgi:cardiolipin synthase
MVVFRDALILFGVLLSQFLSHPLRLEPLLISKVNTVMQIILAAAVLARAGLGIEAWGLADGMVFVVAVTTLWSGTGYLVRWGRLATAIESERQ